MTQFEYKVVPAPLRSKRIKGVRGNEARFAHTLGELMNTLGTEGWQYLRADILPSEERKGLFRRHTVMRNMLVFRRPLTTEATIAETTAPKAAIPSDPAPAPLSAPSTPDAIAKAAAASLSAETPEGSAPAVGPADPKPGNSVAAE